MLLAWSQADGAGGERRGEITSPFLLADVEYGRLPLGPLVLYGTRAGAPLRVEVPADAVGLGVVLRPRFPPALLDLYVRGRTQIDGGRVKEGTALWRDAAARARGHEGGTAAGCWLLGRIGTAWAVAGQGEPAREAWDDATSCAEAVDARAVATILEWQGDQERNLGAPAAALAALEVAAQLRTEPPDSPVLSAVETLLNLAATFQRVPGRTQEAADTRERILRCVEREAPDSVLLSRVLIVIGTAAADRRRHRRRRGDVQTRGRHRGARRAADQHLGAGADRPGRRRRPARRPRKGGGPECARRWTTSCATRRTRWIRRAR